VEAVVWEISRVDIHGNGEDKVAWIWLLGRIEVTAFRRVSEPKKTKDVTHDWDLAGLVSKGLFQHSHVLNFMTHEI